MSEVAEVADRFIERITERLKKNELELPSLPEVAVKVRTEVEKEDSSAADIAKIVSADPAISARLLQVANSPLYRGTSSIDTVQAAVARLGAKTVRNLVTSLVTKQLFQSQSQALKERMQKLWVHSTEVAATAMILARKYTKIDPEEAMLAGLLHDIGAVVVIAEAENHLDVIENPELLESAIETLHGPIGKLVLESWKFSPELILAASEHEHLDRDGEGDATLTDIVMIANLQSYIGKKHRHARVKWNEVPVVAKLGLTPEDSIKAMEEAKKEASVMQQLLQG